MAERPLGADGGTERRGRVRPGGSLATRLGLRRRNPRREFRVPGLPGLDCAGVARARHQADAHESGGQELQGGLHGSLPLIHAARGLGRRRRAVGRTGVRGVGSDADRRSERRDGSHAAKRVRRPGEPLVIRSSAVKPERRRREQRRPRRAVARRRRTQEIAISRMAGTVGRIRRARARATAGLERCGGHREGDHCGQQNAETPHAFIIPRGLGRGASIRRWRDGGRPRSQNFM